jgi:hypothetical protein
MLITTFDVRADEPKPPQNPSGPASINSGVLPEGPHRDLVVRTCAACHPPELVVSKRRTPEEWDDVIARMIDRGAVASEEEQQQIFEYLVRFFGPQSSAAHSP